MKSLRKSSILAVAISLFFIGTALAQPQGGRGMGPGMGRGLQNGTWIEQIIPDLTEDQKTQLEELRFEHQKEMLSYRNQMNELRAKQRTIMSEYPVDTKAADKLIDQKTELMNKQMKARVAHQAEVKTVLTEEQAMKLQQARMNRPGYGRGAGNGKFAHRGYNRGDGYGRGQGRGPGRGMGPCTWQQ